MVSSLLYFWEGEGEVKVFSLLLQETATAEYMPPAPREGRKAVLSTTLNNETALVQHSEHTQQNALKINIHCSLKLTPITIPTSLPSLALTSSESSGSFACPVAGHGLRGNHPC